jgi:hypothetical protein
MPVSIVGSDKILFLSSSEKENLNLNKTCLVFQEKNITNVIIMKSIIRIITLSLGFISLSVSAFPQCTILHRLAPDGSMLYYMDPVNFYHTRAKSLKGCIVSDMESYFLELRPVPVPEKNEGKKLKKDLMVSLSDGKTYQLKHFDTRYVENDTIMELLYLISKDELETFRNFEVIEARIEMGGGEGIRTYVFKLHKTALQEQLACFFKENEKKKKK